MHPSRALRSRPIMAALSLALLAACGGGGGGGSGTCDDLKQGSSKILFNPVVHATNADETGVVSGTVTDASDAPVADVEVTSFPAGTVVDGTTVPTASTFSAPSGLLNAPEGSYALRLDPGSYDLYVRAQGVTVRTLAASSVTVTRNSIATEDLKTS